MWGNVLCYDKEGGDIRGDCPGECPDLGAIWYESRGVRVGSAAQLASFDVRVRLRRLCVCVTDLITVVSSGLFHLPRFLQVCNAGAILAWLLVDHSQVLLYSCCDCPSSQIPEIKGGMPTQSSMF